jgi:hypothetical protein
MNEQEVVGAPLADPEVAFGLAAPYEPSPDFDYHELFTMTWSLIHTPRIQFNAKPGWLFTTLNAWFLQSQNRAGGG